MLRKSLLTSTVFASLTIAAFAENGPVTTQPTIIINNNVANSSPAPAPAPVPAPPPPQQQVVIQQPQEEVTHPWDFIVNVWTHYSNYDSAYITAFTQNGLTNYFGHRLASNSNIVRDMTKDSYRYSQWNATYYPETFWRETSSEYSPNWQGPMIYDHIDMQSNVYETGVRWHHARVRFTVGYTYVNGIVKIYALNYQVLS